jgi:DNA-binding CsgD family transcriptional regulator
LETSQRLLDAEDRIDLECFTAEVRAALTHTEFEASRSDGRALTLFTFASRPGAVGARQIYLAQLLAPAMHAAWVRTQLQRTASAVEKASGHGVLTVREQDILKWIYLGKSNFEIGAILKISPHTVKNHVQKILRKLNVVNRTQAIGEALELRILNP